MKEKTTIFESAPKLYRDARLNLSTQGSETGLISLAWKSDPTSRPKNSFVSLVLQDIRLISTAFQFFFAAKNDKEIALFSINVRALYGEHLDNLDIASEASAGLREDSVEQFTWSLSAWELLGGDIKIHPSSSWIVTAPENGSDIKPYTVSATASLGVNVGWFGKEGTGGQFIQR